MDTNGIDDPPGIKLRPVKGLKGCAYLDPSPLTKPMSYVFGPFFETLQEIGYNDDNLRAATVWTLLFVPLFQFSHSSCLISSMIGVFRPWLPAIGTAILTSCRT